MSNETKQITVNIVNTTAPNTFAALGLVDSEDSILNFSERAAEISGNIIQNMTSEKPEYLRTTALKEIQDTFSPEEILLLAMSHLEDKARSILERGMFMQALYQAKNPTEEPAIPAETSEEESK